MTDDKFHINHLAVLGVGLIGGSLARVLRREGVCDVITGFGRNEDNLKRAVDLGVIDNYALRAGEAVEGADMVVMGTPLSATEQLLRDIKENIDGQALLTDVGSVKRSVVDSVISILDPKQAARFVPGHPIAGTEKSGVDASFPDLFQDHLVILTPGPETKDYCVQSVARMWESAGARVVAMDVSHHDQILAATSHLPHLLAYALVDCLAGMQARDEIFEYAAGGFADFSRIASSSPRMWTDICFANRENLLRMLDLYDDHIRDIREAIKSGDSESLFEIFTRAKQARDNYLKVRSEE